MMKRSLRILSALELSLIVLLMPMLFVAAQPPVPHPKNGLIVFEAEQGIYTINPDGTHLQALLAEKFIDNLSPFWSYDGTQIAFSSSRKDDIEIYVMDADGSNIQRLTHNTQFSDWSPRWSPNGTQIAFASRTFDDSGIYIMASDGSRREIFLDSDTGVFGFGFTWSPDGTRFTCSAEVNGNMDIYDITIESGAVQRLTFDPGFDAWPAWSPDGTQLVFTSQRNDEFDLYIMDLATGQIVQLTLTDGDEYAPQWSPDGAQIVFVSDADGDDDLYIIDTDGKNRHRLTDNNWQDTSPSWQACFSALCANKN